MKRSPNMQLRAVVFVLLASYCAAFVPAAPLQQLQRVQSSPVRPALGVVSMQFGAKRSTAKAPPGDSKIPGITNYAPIKGVLLVGAFLWALAGSAGLI